jgi:hypothetical protein
MAIVRLLSAVTLEHKLVTGRVVTLSHRCPVLVIENPFVTAARPGRSNLVCKLRQVWQTWNTPSPITVAGLELLQQYADRSSDPRLVVPY